MKHLVRYVLEKGHNDLYITVSVVFCVLAIIVSSVTCYGISEARCIVYPGIELTL